MGAESVVPTRLLAGRLDRPMLEGLQTSIRSTPTSARLRGTPEPGPIDISEDCVEETDGYWETNRRSLKDLFYSRLATPPKPQLHRKKNANKNKSMWESRPRHALGKHLACSHYDGDASRLRAHVGH